MQIELHEDVAVLLSTMKIRVNKFYNVILMLLIHLKALKQ